MRILTKKWFAALKSSICRPKMVQPRADHTRRLHYWASVLNWATIHYPLYAMRSCPLEENNTNSLNDRKLPAILLIKKLKQIEK